MKFIKTDSHQVAYYILMAVTVSSLYNSYIGEYIKAIEGLLFVAVMLLFEIVKKMDKKGSNVEEEE